MPCVSYPPKLWLNFSGACLSDSVRAFELLVTQSQARAPTYLPLPVPASRSRKGVVRALFKFCFWLKLCESMSLLPSGAWGITVSWQRDSKLPRRPNAGVTSQRACSLVWSSTAVLGNTTVFIHLLVAVVEIVLSQHNKSLPIAIHQVVLES